MIESLIPMVVMTGMFAMIFGIVYIRSKENMSMIEKGLNPRVKDTRPRPFINLKWGLLLIGSGMGLLLAYIIDTAILPHKPGTSSSSSITIGAHHVHDKLHGHKKTIVVTDTLHNAKDTALLAAAAKDTTNDDGDDDDDHNITEIHGGNDSGNAAIYFALIAIGGGIGLVLSYSIEKKQWLDKNKDIQA